MAHSNNEKHILESVAHPFLVNMWGTFQDDVNLYMVMDYVPGGELFSVLRRSQVRYTQQKVGKWKSREECMGGDDVGNHLTKRILD